MDFDTRVMQGFAAALLALASMPARAQAFNDAKSALVDYAKADLAPHEACDALGKFKSSDIAKIDAASIPADASAPAHCRVTGLLSPEIAFEVSLPAKWNGRFYMIGNGGLAGESLTDPGRVSQRNQALQLGFAFAQTNTGHEAAKEPGGTFAMSNPEKATDYAWRAVHLTAVTAKAITKEYYGKAVARAYWNSCSNGGRQGMLEAERFPEDFDGIVANAPWLNQTGFTVGEIWNQQALTQDALKSAPITPAKLAMVAGKVMAKCDAIDGLKDGLIDDPRKCDFNPVRDVPACAADNDESTCLTPAQADAIEKVYSGAVSNGKPFFPGYMPGSEAVMGLFGGGTGSGWLNVIVAAQPADFNLADNIIRYLVHKPPRPDYNYKTFNFDRDIPMLDDWSKQADAKNPDLAKFRRHGGKLIMTHGWADTILQPMASVDYYEQASAKNGPGTKDFFRLFMVPGMAHCSGGVGPDLHDPVTAVIDWVEKGKAPDSMIAKRVVNNQVVRTRPLCPYPQVARYSGQGSIDDAANFRCVAP